VPVLSPREFMTGRHFDFAVVVGAGEWFPPQLLTCPRAAAITLMHYAHIRDAASFSGIFSDYASVPLRINIHDPVGMPKLPDTSGADDTSMDSAVEQLPTASWDALLASAVGDDRAPVSEERVPSRLLALAENYGMWLPVDAQTVRGLDLSAPVGERVVSLRAGAITAGTIVIAREGGTVAGTLVAMADRLLGSQSVTLRQRQSTWKNALAHEIKRQGAASLDRELKRRGASTANSRFWASDDNIRPLRDRDFALLLDLLGIASGGQHLADGRLLWKVHHQAGNALSDALEEALEAADLTELETLGRQELALADGSATMTVFRVLAVSPDTNDVASSTTRRPFKMRGSAWLE